MAVTGLGVDVEIQMNGEFDVASETGRFDIDADGREAIVTFVEGQRLFLVLPPDAATAAGVECVTAVVDEAAGVDQGLTQNPLDALERLGAIRGEVEQLGTEEIRGVQTTHFRAHYDGTKGLADRERRIFEDNPEMFHDVRNMPLEVWLDEQDRPARMSTSMKFGGAAGTEPGAEMTATFEWFDYGRQVDVQLPAGCREVAHDDLFSYTM